MLSPHLQPYTKPRPAKKPRKPRPEYDDKLTDGLWGALALGLMCGAFVCLIVFGVKILMVFAALAFFAWCLRWAIRIW